MTRTTRIHFGLLTAAVLLMGWQFQQHLRQNRELAAVNIQSRTIGQKLESQGIALAELEKRNRELEEAERRAGNQTLLSLMKERNAAGTALRQAASEKRVLGNATVRVMENPEQQQLEREVLRNQHRADLSVFFKLQNLSPERQEQYIDLQIDMEQRKAARLSALLQGKMTVADAVRERDNDNVESERRRREVLGEKASGWFDELADGIRGDEAKRRVTEIQKNMGAHTLNEEQSVRLQSLIKVQVTKAQFDDIDAFRSPEEFAQVIRDDQNLVLDQAAGFLSPAQLETLKTLGVARIEREVKSMIHRRRALGIR